MRRAGLTRISGLMYEETRGVIKVYLEDLIRDAVTYCEHARRRTVIESDVLRAAQRERRARCFGLDTAFLVVN